MLGYKTGLQTSTDKRGLPEATRDAVPVISQPALVLHTCLLNEPCYLVAAFTDCTGIISLGLCPVTGQSVPFFNSPIIQT